MADLTTGPGGIGERLHALDAARAGALLLGVVFHATMAYLPGPQLWFVQDETAPAMALIFYVTHIFRMALFFLLAGFFARMMFHRKGTGGFIRDRSKRILLPLVVGWPVVMAAIIACFIYGFTQSVPPGTEPPPTPPMTAETFPLTHLWFLYVLIIFYAAALVLRAAVVVIDRKETLRKGLVDPAVRFLAGSPLGLAVLAAPIAAVFVLTPNWYMWFGVQTPDFGLVPNTIALVSFGTVFAFGWLLQRQMSLLETWRRRWPVNLALAIALTAGCLYLAGTAPLLVPAAGDWKEIAYACAYALAIWCWVAGLIGLAMQVLSRRNPAIRYVADASYWIYIAHLPVVMALHAAFLDISLPVWPKFAAVNAIAFAILFLSYALLVRHSFIGAILNGKRPRGNRRIKTAPETVAAK
jgi:peptidoglycan/LPS O-acetylase OafA/YrhL